MPSASESGEGQPAGVPPEVGGGVWRACRMAGRLYVPLLFVSVVTAGLAGLVDVAVLAWVTVPGGSVVNGVPVPGGGSAATPVLLGLAVAGTVVAGVASMIAGCRLVVAGIEGQPVSVAWALRGVVRRAGALLLLSAILFVAMALVVVPFAVTGVYAGTAVGVLVGVGPFLLVCRVLLAIPVLGARPVGAVAATVRAVRLARADHLATVVHLGMVPVVSALAWLPSWTVRSLFAGGPAVVAGNVAAVVLGTLLAPVQAALLAGCYTHLCRRAGQEALQMPVPERVTPRRHGKAAAVVTVVGALVPGALYGVLLLGDPLGVPAATLVAAPAGRAEPAPPRVVFGADGAPVIAGVEPLACEDVRCGAWHTVGIDEKRRLVDLRGTNVVPGSDGIVRIVPWVGDGTDMTLRLVPCPRPRCGDLLQGRRLASASYEGISAYSAVAAGSPAPVIASVVRLKGTGGPSPDAEKSLKALRDSASASPSPSLALSQADGRRDGARPSPGATRDEHASSGEAGRDHVFLSWVQKKDDSSTVQLTLCESPACASPRTVDMFRAVADIVYHDRPLAVAVGTTGRAVVAHFDRERGLITVAVCGSVSCADHTVQTLGPLPDDWAVSYDYVRLALAVRRDGRPVLVYNDAESGAARILTCATATCAGTPKVTELRRLAPLRGFGFALDDRDRPLIAGYSRDDDRVTLLACADDGCDDVREAPLLRAAELGPLELAIGPDRLPRIVWGAAGEYHILTCDRPRCGL
ncbi:hypothetical protein ABZT47_00600 [Sphaerisporangium sp. NPDC005289]|uniref:hypothetical protein n=1 Tax=Sphaerisporangium sp. NPDC005289 TaxID=3155247 RepID=UPI0033B6F806